LNGGRGVSARKRFLLICSDIVAQKMAGPAIRYVEMATALSRQYEVALVAPGAVASSTPHYELLPDTAEVVKEQARRADFVLCQSDRLEKYPVLREVPAVLIADLYCPVPLEYHQSSVGVAPDVRVQMAIHLGRQITDQLSFADYFICANEKQRDFWLGGLALAGRINGVRWVDTSHAQLDQLVSLVPFGMSDQPPVKTGPGLRARFNLPPDDFVAVWGGGIYQWFDPLTLIRAVHRLVQDGQRVHLVFMGVGHPNPNIHEHEMCTRAIALAGELGLTDRFVHFNLGWVEYEARQNYLLEADIGVSAHFDNPETRFAFRTRMLDYLWCGLPVVSTRGDVFAQHVQDRRLGIVVGYESVDDWVAALLRIKNDAAFYGECKRHIAEFSPAFTWRSIMDRFILNIDGLEAAADREPIRRAASARRTGLSIAAKVRRAFAEGGLRRVGVLTARKLGVDFGGSNR
jgi:glycosyltransferase involved in cell wall biosynthesis